MTQEDKDKYLYKYSDGTWGWYDETWNEGDAVHYATADLAAEAQLRYCKEYL